jgi:hypothetical protein
MPCKEHQNLLLWCLFPQRDKKNTPNALENSQQDGM